MKIPQNVSAGAEVTAFVPWLVVTVVPIGGQARGSSVNVGPVVGEDVGPAVG